MNLKLRSGRWSIFDSAVYGSLAGMGASALNQIHHAFSYDILGDVVTHVLGEMIGYAIGGATLFTLIALLRNWHCDRR
jgi:hypothetical protein